MMVVRAPLCNQISQVLLYQETCPLNGNNNRKRVKRCPLASSAVQAGRSCAGDTEGLHGSKGRTLLGRGGDGNQTRKHCGGPGGDLGAMGRFLECHLGGSAGCRYAGLTL